MFRFNWLEKRADRAREEFLRHEICAYGRIMRESGLIVAAEGNLSVRLGTEIIITPSGVDKGRMDPDYLAVIDYNGVVGYKRKNLCKPSSEWNLHTVIYRYRPDVNAVCHAHPPTATGFAVAQVSLDPKLMPELAIGCSWIPLASYGTPGTAELAKTIVPIVYSNEIILLENHGVVTMGVNLREAFYRMELVEQLAKVTIVAKAVGKPRPLTRDELLRLAKSKV